MLACFFPLRRDTPLICFPMCKAICSGYHPCTLLYRVTRSHRAFKMWKYFIFLISSFVRCCWMFFWLFLNDILMSPDLSWVAIGNSELPVAFAWLRWSSLSHVSALRSTILCLLVLLLMYCTICILAVSGKHDRLWVNTSSKNQVSSFSWVLS